MTLENIWDSRPDTTKIARRAGKPQIYVSLGHKTKRKAFDAAMAKQKQMDHEDFTENDWYVE